MEQLSQLSDEDLAEWVRLQQKAKDLERYDWERTARPEQVPPDDYLWLIWLYLAGRGAGKTRSGAEWLKKMALKYPNTRWAIVAPTFSDVRDTMIEGESGLLSVTPLELIKTYNRSTAEIVLTNGSRIKGYSADQPERLRGPQFHGAWVDELAAWRYPEAWDQLMFGLRLGTNPQTVITTTPKPTKLIRDLISRESGVMVTRGNTFDNAANLAPSALAELKARYEGTRLGRQELYAELLTDTPGALWTIDLLDETRVKVAPDPVRICVAVDPSGGHEEENDEQGIFAVSRGTDGDIYGLEDRSCKLTPDGWARRAIQLYIDIKADILIGEKNYGGEMVEHTIRTVANDMGVKVNFQLRTASRGKSIRAEPISALFEQHKGHLVGTFNELEEELTTWTQDSGWSPNRLDAFVWAATEVAESHKMDYAAPEGSFL